jgi:MG2 domain.
MMFKIPVRLVVILAIAFTAFPARSQQIDSMINVYGEKFPHEKVYVQFDKPAYNTGETIWFKAYLFAGIMPSGVSRNFYAELVDPNGKVLQQKVMPVYEGSSAGFFDIPESMNNSTLVFRAYTTWMLNFDSAFLFTKTIRILNKTAAASATAAASGAAKPATGTSASKSAGASAARPATNLRFFPEGGELVSGLESVVAFKATDQYGLPVSVSGLIKDNTGADVAPFQSTHDGMGRFVLEPQPGKTYTAEWTDENKQTYKTPLPPVKKTGVVLQTLQANNRQSFIIRRSQDAPANLKTLYILGYFNQQVVYKARLNMSESFMVSGSIPLDGIPTGILQLTLFDGDWKPQAERIAFVNKDDYFFSTKLVPALVNTQKRGKNILVIDVPDTLRTNLSISITDEGVSKTDPDADNIVSHLLLGSDLRGYVHNPYYYFTGNDDTLKAHLDLVMMTNGWRRYKWDDLAAGLLPQIKFPRDNYLSLNATLTGLLPSQIPRNTQLNVFLEGKDSSRQLFMLTMDSAGKFKEDGLVFFDTMKVFYQFNNNKTLGTKAVVNFTNGTYKSAGTVKPDSSWRVPMPIDTSILNRGKYFASEAVRIKPEIEKKVKTLEAVTVKARTKSKQQIMDERYTSGFFSGGDAVSFDLTDDPAALGAMNIFTYLQGRVAGLQITAGGGAGGTQLSWRGARPALFLNEMPVDVSQIENIPVADIAYVKAFRPPFFGATGGGAGGAIAIYTKKGGETSSQNTDFVGLDKAKLMGYAAPKEFYSPDYSKDNPMNDVPDIRTTLYWSPYILTDKSSRKVTLTFYNNDVSKKLRVVIEGMNEYGQLTRVEKILD